MHRVALLMKTRVFYKNKVYVNPPNAAAMIADGGILNPDLKALRGIPPHIWEQKGTKIIANPNKLKAYKDHECVECKKKGLLSKIKDILGELI